MVDIKFTYGDVILTEEEMEKLGWVTIERLREEEDLADSYFKDYWDLKRQERHEY